MTLTDKAPEYCLLSRLLPALSATPLGYLGIGVPLFNGRYCYSLDFLESHVERGWGRSGEEQPEALKRALAAVVRSREQQEALKRAATAATSRHQSSLLPPPSSPLTRAPTPTPIFDMPKASYIF